MINLNAGSRYIYGQPYIPPPPVFGIIAETGLGKTYEWCQSVAKPLVEQGRHPILAVPRHRLGEETVETLAEPGVKGFVYRGRDADDPLAPGHKMCRELERIGAIGDAFGSV